MHIGLGLGLIGQRDAGIILPSAIPNLAYWHEFRNGSFQTNGGSAAVADSDPIGYVTDLSGNGRHLTQATAGSRFALKTGANGLDGVAVGRADGTDDYLSGAIPASATWTKFFVVLKRSVVSGTNRIFYNAGTSNNARIAAVTGGADWQYSLNEAAGNTALGGVSTAWQILVIRHTALNSAQVWRAGVSLATFDPADGYSTATAHTLGASAAGASPGDYDYAADLGYARALTNSETNTVAAYLRSWLPSLTWSNI